MSNFKMCKCMPSVRRCYECARCRQTFCMECDRPQDADEVKTIVRYCPDWRCQREKNIEEGISETVKDEIEKLHEIVEAAKRLIENAETITIQGTGRPYTPKIVYASDLADVISGKLR